VAREQLQKKLLVAVATHKAQVVIVTAILNVTATYNVGAIHNVNIVFA
jgi:hypothetical protein